MAIRSIHDAIDPAAIEKTVRTAFGVHAAQSTTPRITPTSIVDVVNAGHVTGMAAIVSNALADKGFGRGTIGNAGYDDGPGSVVYYGSGADTDATRIAEVLGSLPTAASTSVALGHVKVVIGNDFVLPQESTISTMSSSSNSTDSPTSTTTSAADSGNDTGKPVTTVIGSKSPCVN